MAKLRADRSRTERFAMFPIDLSYYRMKIVWWSLFPIAAVASFFGALGATDGRKLYAEHETQDAA